jgi:hypothetical protein
VMMAMTMATMGRRMKKSATPRSSQLFGFVAGGAAEG